MGRRTFIIWCVCFILALGAIGVGVVRAAGPEYGCQEDMKCWDCETMGDRVCGRVNVEVMDNGFVQVWDEHNNVVFGPVLLEGIEK